MNDEIEARKREHIRTVLDEDVRAKGITPGFEDYAFDHNALPEIDLDAIDLSVLLFGRRLQAPFLVSSMTGGTSRARDINLALAEVAQSHRIAMGVGSQRAALLRPDLENTYRIRSVAPDILLFANLGAVQFNYGFGVDEAQRAIEMIEADALILHFNPLQEAVQQGGDHNWSGLLRKLEAVVQALDVPVIAKEVGNGISAEVARRLANAGFAAIDVAGAGGTSWSEVEAFRQSDPLIREIAHGFAGWGIPSAQALVEVVEALPSMTVFASGGLRSGLDAAKAIRLGASLVGMAAPMLGSVVETDDALSQRLEVVREELRIAMFCTGSHDLDALRHAPLRRVTDSKRLS